MASVYQSDLPQMHDGQIAMLSDPTGATPARRGEVTFVYPDVHADTRAGQVRIEVSNADGALKPGMFVDVSVSVALGRRLAVPESAVLPTGTRNVVFVDLGDGRLEPRDVTLGVRAGEWIEVRSGLAEGERVVTSGNFLLAAESKLRSAAGKW
jgi:Cu(I)/Ag(I) efflux system membrane fusion protein